MILSHFSLTILIKIKSSTTQCQQGIQETDTRMLIPYGWSRCIYKGQSNKIQIYAMTQPISFVGNSFQTYTYVCVKKCVYKVLIGY